MQPFYLRSTTYLTALNETVVLICFVTSFVFRPSESINESERQTFTLSMLSLIALNIGINVLVVTVQTVLQLKSKLREIKIKMRRVKNWIVSKFNLKED